MALDFLYSSGSKLCLLLAEDRLQQVETRGKRWQRWREGAGEVEGVGEVVAAAPDTTLS